MVYFLYDCLEKIQFVEQVVSNVCKANHCEIRNGAVCRCKIEQVIRYIGVDEVSKYTYYFACVVKLDRYRAVIETKKR